VCVRPSGQASTGNRGSCRATLRFQGVPYKLTCRSHAARRERRKGEVQGTYA